MEVNGSVSPPNLTAKRQNYFSTVKRLSLPLKTFNNMHKIISGELVSQKIPCKRYYDKIFQDKSFSNNLLVITEKSCAGSEKYAPL